VEEAEQRNRERLTEARKRSPDLEALTRRARHPAGGGGLLGTRMHWDSEMNEGKIIWYIVLYTMVYHDLY
jgi:hypothetical protein